MEKLKLIDDKTVSLYIPIKFKKRSACVMIIIPEDSSIQNDKNYDSALVKAVLRAYKWQQMLQKDSKITMAALAKKEKVNLTYFRRTYRLNCLAPDIIDAIICGTQPRTLKLQDFKIKEIPDLWDEQRKVFGFTE